MPRNNATYCSAPQCKQYAAPSISFHLFPTDPKLRKKWESQLRMGKPSSARMRVCSNHFSASDYFPSCTKKKRLYPTAFPTQNLPERNHDRKVTSPQKHQKEARKMRAEKRNKAGPKNVIEENRSVHEEISDHDADDSEETGILYENLGETGEVSDKILSFHASVQANIVDFRKERSRSNNEDTPSFANLLSDGTLDKCTQVNFLPVWEDENCKCEPKITLTELLSTKEILFTFTGIHSLVLLDGLVECAEELALDASTNKKLLSVKDRIILTMVKVKQNMCFTALGLLFGINRQTCSNYFKNMCPILARVLKVVIPFPDQAMIRCNLPLSFKNFKNTRIVLDCCEVTLEKCKCLKCRILTYSQYKKNHTVKFNMGIAPSGLITEASSPFGGRASDKHIVVDSRILDKLDYADGVMVDKGYRIEKECLERNLTLIRPPFLGKEKQLSKEEALLCADVARARVHIERVFQRMRQYAFLRGPVPWVLAPYFEDILTITRGLTNLGPPVMNIDKFM